VLIDWFTVMAQIINFLILIWLMNRFLFKPIRGAMQQREKSMADALNRAKQAEKQAQARALELQEEQRALENARQRLMTEAQDQVARWREETIATIREEVETLRRTFMANMTRDRQAFLERLKRHLVRQVMRIGEKVLRDLADQRLNRQVLRVFLEKLAPRRVELNHQVLKQEILVQSGVPLDDDDTRALREQLGQWFPGCSGIRYESSPDLGLGIQLVIGDRKAAWHLADYLGDLEAEIMENLVGDPRVKP
jgi:F-type H+-transporting ATPase subunit b